MLPDKRFLNLTISYIRRANIGHLSLLFWLGLMLPLTALGQWPASFQLTPDTHRVEVTPHMAILLDADGRLNIEQVATAAPQAWSPLTGHLSMGFTKTVVWLRLEIAPTPTGAGTAHSHQHSHSHTQWLLEVTQPSLTNVQMFHRLPNGYWARHRGTRNNDTLPQAYDHRSALFDIPTDATQPQIVYLRLQSETSMSSTFVVWERHAFWTHQTEVTLIWGLVYGFCILVILLHAAFSFWSKSQLHLIYALYIVSTFSISFLTSGWHLVLFNAGSMEQWLYVIGVFTALPLITGISFGVLFLGALQTRPLFGRIQIGTSCTIGALSILGVAAGHYISVMPVLQLSMMILVCTNIVLATLELRDRNPKAAIFLWAFGIFYAGVIVRLLRNRGVLEPSLLTETSYQIGAFLHIFIISYGIIAFYSNLQQEKKAALEVANKETEQRKEQAVFLGMVSHELRTPITIISATLDNLQNGLHDSAMTQKRIQKIARATYRMESLVESFLNAERMNQTRFEPHKKLCKLDKMLHESIALIHERTSHPIQLETTTASDFLCQADRQLLSLAIDNIVLNAVQHSVPDALVRVILGTTDTGLTIEISNQGKLIDEADLPKLFERYHRGKNALDRPGTGLGLHVAYTIISKHGGTLQAANRTDGCVFIIRLPNSLK